MTSTNPVDQPVDQPAAQAAACADITGLDARVIDCRACPRLVAWREEVARTKRAAYRDQEYWGRPVPGFGEREPRLLIVGLAPGAHGANRTGRMFTGDRSGDWLYAALHRAGLAALPTSTSIDDGQRLVGTRIVAAVHCVPPGNAPTPLEEVTCAPWLDRELTLDAPTLTGILALGAIGWKATLRAAGRLGWTILSGPHATGGTRTPARPRFGHGAAVTLISPSAPAAGRTIRLVASYHVSQQNTFTRRLTPEMLDTAIRQAMGGPDQVDADGTLSPWPTT